MLIGMILSLVVGCTQYPDIQEPVQQNMPDQTEQQPDQEVPQEPIEQVPDEPSQEPIETPSESTGEYNPEINPDDFTTDITNPFSSMPPGKKMVYESDTDRGTEQTVALIPGWTKEVMGVQTLVFWNRVYLNDELVEDTRDYIAQDMEGNVWYFGKDVDIYAQGILSDHYGSWIAGVDNAKPGICMLADPQLGNEYRQDYYAGVAEDWGRVAEMWPGVSVPAGDFSECISIYEWTALVEATAHKFHCKEVGGVALEDEEGKLAQLIEVNEAGANCIALPSQYQEEGVMPADTSSCSEIAEA